jgi:hypothetical protein
MNRQRSIKLLLQIHQTFKIEVKQISDESYELFSPNWLKLQETRGGKRQAKTEQKMQKIEDRREKREVRKKKVDKEPLITFENFRPEQVVKDKWKQIYDMEYLSYQDKQMELWLLSNPEKDSKTQRGWTQFMTNWFARGWARWQEEHKQKVNINGFDPRLKLPENY